MPRHRDMLAGPSRLRVRRQSSRRMRQTGGLSFLDGGSIESVVMVKSHCEEDLWYINPGQRVACTWCGEVGPQLGGRLQGAPGRPAFAQREFVCRACLEFYCGDQPFSQPENAALKEAEEND